MSTARTFARTAAPADAADPDDSEWAAVRSELALDALQALLEALPPGELVSAEGLAALLAQARAQ